MTDFRHPCELVFARGRMRVIPSRLIPSSFISMVAGWLLVSKFTLVIALDSGIDEQHLSCQSVAGRVNTGRRQAPRPIAMLPRRFPFHEKQFYWKLSGDSILDVSVARGQRSRPTTHYLTVYQNAIGLFPQIDDFLGQRCMIKKSQKLTGIIFDHSLHWFILPLVG